MSRPDPVCPSESQHLNAEGQSRLTRADRRRRSSFIQRGLFWGAHDQLIDTIRQFKLDELSPDEALAKLREIQEGLND